MEQKYQYERHLCRGDGIRLVQIEAGSRASLLKGSMHYCHLSGTPEYQAISYTWNNPFNTEHPLWSQYERSARQHTLRVDDGILKITGNLYDALVQLRQPTKAILLWVDAISIDQSHDEEKSWQIKQMPQIYEQASRVVIWLGPSNASSDIAMSTLLSCYSFSIRSEQHKKLGSSWVDVPPPATEQELRDQLTAASFGKMFGMVAKSEIPIPDYPIEAVADLINRAYWGRGWCWQECALAKRIVLACGTKALEDGDLCIQTFIYTWDLLRDQSGRMPYNLDHRAWSMMELRRSYQNIVHLERIGFKDDANIQTPDAKMPMKAWAYQNPEMKPMGKVWMFREARNALSMKELLKESSISGVETGYKEDQIFALIGMASDAEQLEISINCTVAWEEIYTQVATAFAKLNDLWFLHYCQGTLQSRSPKLPSWVPDWSEGYRGGHIERHYVPSGKHLGKKELAGKPDLQEVESHGHLRLRGIVADEVVWVSSERFPLSMNLLRSKHRKGLYQWIRQIVSICHEHSRRTIWTVLIANSFDLPLFPEAREKLTDEEHRKKLDAVFDSILERDESQDDALRPVIDGFLRCFMQATAWRSICRTKSGRLGLAHNQIRSGDQVAVFMGTNTAFIVRPLAHGVSEPRYRLVCESYMHGLLEDEQLQEHAVVNDVVLE